ncbi:hypothetical protein HY838_00785 [Candidatus Azambacteria bacterium]|nr:hypothetical protein [Candidatus Azambacteria bacterium]
MADPMQKPEDIVIRTMKSDLEKLSGIAPKKEEVKPAQAPAPVSPIFQESQYKAPQAQMPAPQPLPPAEKPFAPVEKPSIPPPIGRPPVLIVPPKPVLPKEAEIPKPAYKIAPVWIKLGIIGLAIIVLALSGLYGYWKIFVQSKPAAAPQITPPAAITPTLPAIPTATTTAPIKFFTKLPNKSITIDLPSKTSATLIQTLKSEAEIEEPRASVKQLKITYKGESITAEEFLNLMQISAPKDFLSNCENEFAFAYFAQKEGVRPILILKTKDRGLAQKQTADWEKTTLANDIFPLFLSDSALPKISQTFKPYLFIGQPVRYLNVGVPFASLNYAIYNDYLIFTTSSAGMFVILQDLTGQTVSYDYIKSLEASINSFVK